MTSQLALMYDAPKKHDPKIVCKATRKLLNAMGCEKTNRLPVLLWNRLKMPSGGKVTKKTFLSFELSGINLQSALHKVTTAKTRLFF